MTSTLAARHHHLEDAMGTLIGIASPDPLPEPGIADAVRTLHEADRIFSTWQPNSPISQLRTGRATLDDFAPTDAALIRQVLDRCARARELTSGTFDPWAMPGGVDPTGLVKGWAAQRAMNALLEAGATNVMVNAGGDIIVTGQPDARPWRIGVRHPAQPQAYAAVVEVTAAIATSGDYERPGQLIEPSTGRTSGKAASATVTGPDLGLADALATAVAVRGTNMLAAIDALDGYEAYVITDDLHHYATPGFKFAAT